MANKNKKTSLQVFLKKCRKFLINGKPMSQIVHWSIIWGISWVFALNIVRAGEIIEAVGK